jgi:Xaa-Pro dipeptidase
MNQEKQNLETIYLARLERLGDAAREAGLDALALNPGPTLTYLTGLHFHIMERPVVGLFPSGKAPIIILPNLEMAKIRELTYPVQAFSYGDNPATWGEAFYQAAQFAGLEKATIGIEPLHLRVLELRFLEDALPEAQFISAQDLLAGLRMYKDSAEVDAMRRAVKIAQEAFTATLPSIHIGATERVVASELTVQLLRAGSDSSMPFSPIVSGGPNSANPHAVPTERRLQSGDLLVIDWGAAYNGYISDLTRTLAIGSISPEFERIAEVTRLANEAGRAAARPGIPAGAVDQAAREVIEDSGYGQYFTHRVGHGIGMEGHEDPYMFAENKLILEPGMAFTVEPGIYLPDRGGVRIEDDVVITESGVETLSDLPRELYRIKA